MDPKVTVVVPTFRRSHLLDRLHRSLERQTYPHDRFDVVIVDNDSPDDTAMVLKQIESETTIELRHLVETQRGPAATRNRGWRATSSEIIAFLDDDCAPEPGWLEAGVAALVADDTLGVVQGCTRLPSGSSVGDWTLTRQIAGHTPYFEGLNIFYRRAAIEQTDGFDEGIGNYGEDAALGWAVVDAGWRAGYAPDAVVFHDAEERGVRYHMWTGVRERNVALLAKRHPGFRQEAFWRPWAFRWENAAFTVAVIGLLAAPWRRLALLLVLPYARFLRIRFPQPDHPHRLRWLAERIAVDASQFVGMRVGNIRYRIAVL